MDLPLTPELELFTNTLQEVPPQRPQSDVTPAVTDITGPRPESLTIDRLQELHQMQKMDPFCKQISKHLSYRKAPTH